jgi:hypothetical protein
LGLVLLLGASPSLAQRARPGFDAPPFLAPGQRVRVWTWEPTPVLRAPRQFLRDVRIVGTLLEYDPPDSLRLRKAGPFAVFSLTPEHTAYWASVTRIDVPNGRDVLSGAAGGLAGAFGIALLTGLVERAFGCAVGDNCGSVFTYTAQVAIFTVPAGTVVGFFSTRWKRVY